MTVAAHAPGQPQKPPDPRGPGLRALPRAPLTRGDRRFLMGLAIASLVHLTLLIGFLAAPESLTKTRLGEPGADPDGVSVEIVDMADLKSRSNVPLEGTLPAPPVEQQKPEPPQQQQQQQPREQPKTAEAEPPQAEPKTQSRSEARETPQEKSEAIEAPGAPPPPSSDTPHEQRKPAQKQASRPPSPNAQPQKKSLDLTVPSTAFNVTPRSFQPMRPAGVTRSGENDQFFLGVIRALRRTFPELRTTGIVTVRILLNEKGNIKDISVVRTSSDPILDQNVVFAARQASFPLPPDNSTVLDRTFLITYIYR